IQALMIRLHLSRRKEKACGDAEKFFNSELCTLPSGLGPHTFTGFGTIRKVRNIRHSYISCKSIPRVRRPKTESKKESVRRMPVRHSMKLKQTSLPPEPRPLVFEQNASPALLPIPS